MAYLGSTLDPLWGQPAWLIMSAGLRPLHVRPQTSAAGGQRLEGGRSAVGQWSVGGRLAVGRRSDGCRSVLGRTAVGRQSVCGRRRNADGAPAVMAFYLATSQVFAEIGKPAVEPRPTYRVGYRCSAIILAPLRFRLLHSNLDPAESFLPSSAQQDKVQS